MRLAVLILSGCCLAGCGTSTPQQCLPYAFHQQGGDRGHVASCSDPTCGNGLNPPTAGPHCGSTLACRVFTAEQSRCTWVHNLEHGHAVLLYNCPSGCPEIVAGLQAIYDASPSPKRMIVAPDPNIPTAVAAVVWGWSWTGDTADATAIGCLLAHQDEEAPERGLGCAP